MKLSFGSKSKVRTKKTILFVCVENAGRSQMAEGFFWKYAPEGYGPLSAGTKPTSQINPLAIQVMNEIGIDIYKQRSKDLTEDMMRNSDKIINMGCMDKNFCPTLFIPKVIDWGIEDPKDKPIEKVREIRDEIERRIKELATDVSVAEEDNSR
ncbi:MAG: arsenate reductase ArsC [Nitrososphaeraceae archaeon]|nr:arsenate reductase ArsC [Nitrososphaeraceae archaeon]